MSDGKKVFHTGMLDPNLKIGKDRKRKIVGVMANVPGARSDKKVRVVSAEAKAKKVERELKKHIPDEDPDRKRIPGMELGDIPEDGKLKKVVNKILGKGKKKDG